MLRGERLAQHANPTNSNLASRLLNGGWGTQLHGLRSSFLTTASAQRYGGNHKAQRDDGFHKNPLFGIGANGGRINCMSLHSTR